jgi:hypothetical protein
MKEATIALRHAIGGTIASGTSGAALLSAYNRLTRRVSDLAQTLLILATPN